MNECVCVCVCVCVCIVLSNLYFGMHTCPFGRSFLGLVDRYFGVGICAIVFRHVAVYCMFSWFCHEYPRTNTCIHH